MILAEIVCPAEAVKYVNDVALSSKNVKTESLNEMVITYWSLEGWEEIREEVDMFKGIMNVH